MCSISRTFKNTPKNSTSLNNSKNTGEKKTRTGNNYFAQSHVSKRFLSLYKNNMVATRYKAQDYWLSLAGVAGSNTAEGMDVYLLWVSCVGM